MGKKFDVLKLAQNLAICAVLLLPLFSFVAPAPANALSGSSFQPGRIIDNSTFFNGSAMSIAQIQSFLNAKVPDCDSNGDETIYDSDRGDTVTRRTYAARRGVSTPFKCLKGYSVTTNDKAAESGLCGFYDGKPDQSSASIIYNVAKSCGVSAKVLLVLLQKEQSLVTDDWPWPIQYRSATGYGCPDTAPCDSQYYGFFNQVYRAARQYKRYAKDASLFNYRAGRTNRVPYHPNTSCGYSNFVIENQATAGLYNYTPYRPNKAALDNLYGTGNSCSSYGNRNFWRMFSDWFGPTIGNMTLIKTSSSPNTYIAGATDKVLIDSYDAYILWELNNFPVDTVGQSVMDLYPTASSSLTRIATSSSSGYKYVADRGNAYRIHSTTSKNAWGFASSPAPAVNSKIITGLNVKTSLPQLAASKDSGNVYLVTNDSKLLISDPTTLELMRGSRGTVGFFSTPLLSGLTTGPGINFAFKVGTTWYVFDYGVIRPVDAAYVPRIGLSGPTLDASVLSQFRQANTISKGFYYNGRWYRFRSDGTLQSTASKSGAQSWGVYQSPHISKYLYSKLK